MPEMLSPVDVSYSHSYLDRLYVVGGQHAGLSSTLHCAIHPALINGLDVQDDVSIFEGHLVIVGSSVVIHGTNSFLWREKIYLKIQKIFVKLVYRLHVLQKSVEIHTPVVEGCEGTEDTVVCCVTTEEDLC